MRVSVSEDRARLRLESAHLAVQAEADELVPARSADEVVVRSLEQLAEGLIVTSVAAHRAPLKRDAASDELGVIVVSDVDDDWGVRRGDGISTRRGRSG